MPANSERGAYNGDVVLINKLGYREPDLAEVTSCVALSPEDRFVPAYLIDRPFHLQAAVLSSIPFVSFSGITPYSLLGVAGLLPPTRSRRSGWFLLSPTWSIETRQAVMDLRINAVLHRLRRPHDRIVFVCNTPQEMTLLHEVGEAAVSISKTCDVSEQVFYPLPGVEPEFSAVYNAQLKRWKRHDLTLALKTCLFVCYRSGDETPEQKQFEETLFATHAPLAPGHLFANEFNEFQVPVRFTPDEVNRQLNRARVGLCLSSVEGAMFASVEYLLAGLPIVTVPSKGGRNGYFDDDYCMTVEPEAELVNEAVEQLIARAIAREDIRNRTLEKLKADRNRIAALLNDILAECGKPPRFDADTLFGTDRLLEWMPSRQAIAQTGLIPG